MAYWALLVLSFKQLVVNWTCWLMPERALVEWNDTAFAIWAITNMLIEIGTDELVVVMFVNVLLAEIVGFLDLTLSEWALGGTYPTNGYTLTVLTLQRHEFVRILEVR